MTQEVRLSLKADLSDVLAGKHIITATAVRYEAIPLQ
jgi:hypothetical protein